MQNKKVFIENPCPMKLNGTSNPEEYYCKSCKQSIIDFRQKTNDEIIEHLSKNKACGIFNKDQIQTKHKSFRYQFIFKILTLVALIGFNVKPISAQTFLKGSKEEAKELKERAKNERKERRYRRKNKRFDRKHKRRKSKNKNEYIMGVPNF